MATNDFLRNVKEVQREAFQDEPGGGLPFFSSNAIDAGLKIRNTEAELKETGTEFNQLWDRYSTSSPRTRTSSRFWLGFREQRGGPRAHPLEL